MLPTLHILNAVNVLWIQALAVNQTGLVMGISGNSCLGSIRCLRTEEQQLWI